MCTEQTWTWSETPFSSAFEDMDRLQPSERDGGTQMKQVKRGDGGEPSEPPCCLSVSQISYSVR